MKTTPILLVLNDWLTSQVGPMGADMAAIAVGVLTLFGTMFFLALILCIFLPPPKKPEEPPAADPKPVSASDVHYETSGPPVRKDVVQLFIETLQPKYDRARNIIYVGDDDWEYPGDRWNAYRLSDDKFTKLPRHEPVPCPAFGDLTAEEVEYMAGVIFAEQLQAAEKQKLLAEARSKVNNEKRRREVLESLVAAPKPAARKEVDDEVPRVRIRVPAVPSPKAKPLLVRTVKTFEGLEHHLMRRLVIAALDRRATDEVRFKIRADWFRVVSALNRYRKDPTSPSAWALLEAVADKWNLDLGFDRGTVPKTNEFFA